MEREEKFGNQIEHKITREGKTVYVIARYVGEYEIPNDMDEEEFNLEFGGLVWELSVFDPRYSSAQYWFRHFATAEQAIQEGIKAVIEEGIDEFTQPPPWLDWSKSLS